jgi:hypothetical protein
MVFVQRRYRFVYWFFYAKHGSFEPRISTSRQCITKLIQRSGLYDVMSRFFGTKVIEKGFA